jgi:alanine dehydrogenase
MASGTGFTLENSLFPVEEMLETGKKQQKLIIGVPKDTVEDENRVAMSPQGVNFLVENGHQVVIEAKAGEASCYTDMDYSERGGIITENKSDVFRSDIILKVAPFNAQEINLLRNQQTVFSSFHLQTQDPELLRRMMDKKITAVAFDYIKDETDNSLVVDLMSEILGTEAILIASEYMSNARGGKGVLLGGITGISPAEVVILGANTAGEFAARTALGLGAIVKVFDSSITRLTKIQSNLGRRLFTSIFHPQVVLKALKSAEVVIGALDMLNSPYIRPISEDFVTQMKHGAVIIDLSINQGGCFETSQITSLSSPVYKKFGIIHYCVPNIPSRVARTATIALSNIFSPIMYQIGENGGIHHALKENQGLRKGVYIYKGILTNQTIANRFNMRAQDIDLLMAVI